MGVGGHSWGSATTEPNGQHQSTRVARRLSLKRALAKTRVYRLDALNQFSGHPSQNMECFGHAFPSKSLRGAASGVRPLPDGNMWQTYKKGQTVNESLTRTVCNHLGPARWVAYWPKSFGIHSEIYQELPKWAELFKTSYATEMKSQEKIRNNTESQKGQLHSRSRVLCTCHEMNVNYASGQLLRWSSANLNQRWCHVSRNGFQHTLSKNSP